MLYLSTRNNKIEKNASQAVLEGLASDGGLYMPNSFEGAKFPMDKLAKMNPWEISATVLSLLFAGDKMLSEAGSEYEAAYKLVEKAYKGSLKTRITHP